MTGCIGPFINKISFLDFDDQISMRNSFNPKVGKPTRYLHDFGSFCLWPARFLLKGHSVYWDLVPKAAESNNGCCLPNLLKGIAAILLLLPCGLIGFLVKSTALICSKELRDKYHDLSTRLSRDPSLPDWLQDYKDCNKHVSLILKNNIKTKININGHRDVYHSDEARIGHLIATFYHAASPPDKPEVYYSDFYKMNGFEKRSFSLDSLVKECDGTVNCETQCATPKPKMSTLEPLASPIVVAVENQLPSWLKGYENFREYVGGPRSGMPQVIVMKVDTGWVSTSFTHPARVGHLLAYNYHSRVYISRVYKQGGGPEFSHDAFLKDLASHVDADAVYPKLSATL